jgi:sugar phosphate permease
MGTKSVASTSNNFGGKGWLMIVIAGVYFYYYAAFCTDSLNVIVENFAVEHGLDANVILGMVTPASIVSLVGSIVWAAYVDRFGSRIGAVTTGILGGICYMLYGVADSAAGFAIITALVAFFGLGFCWTVSNTLLASWFPTRKGLALGWATMGQQLSTATSVPILMYLTVKISLSGSFYTMGASLVVISIIIFFIVRDDPEQYGCAPDNAIIPKEELEANLEKIRAYKSPWHYRRFLSNKRIWQIGFAYGFLVMVTVSLVSQMVPRLIGLGMEPGRAASMMSVAAVCGLLGSYLTGWLDQKLGTRKASIIYGFWYLTTLIICILPPNSFFIYASVVLTGFGIGGIGNLFPSMTGTIFGRYDFVNAIGILNLITNLVRSFTFVILAFGLSNLGGYAGAYTIIAILNVVAIVIIWRMKEEMIGSSDEDVFGSDANDGIAQA